MKKFAEIWCVCASPQRNHLATSSEDQTSVIWDLEGNKVHTFVGHSTAVTAIDWKFDESNRREIFMSSGDDQKIIIWQLNEKDDSFKRKWLLYGIL